ncbi:glycoside hydrolase family 28 protein [Paenibacillus sp. 1P07SE]|uniref:glycoside hydrolase family 28 protein n=1 Tax=Paenibacillus sp. 1P07SE TaxID=3132209 RepID=UPI0039A72F20
MKQSVYNIMDYGIQEGGRQLITAALQRAVDDCAGAGGGIVSLPAGDYVCGTVELKSNVTLLLEQGAVLRASERMEDYRQIGFYHNEMGETVSFLYALGGRNIRITGDGEIQLSDHAFIDFNRLHPFQFEESDLTEEQREEATAMYLDRPNQPIFFHGCSHVTVDRLKISRAPYWTLTFSCCEQVVVDQVCIVNHLRVPNSDGIHLCSSKDVRITNCQITSGDDCIAITGITAWDGVSERILIQGCILTSHSSAIRMGHLASKVRDVMINTVMIRGTNRGLGLFAGDGGFVERVSARHLTIDTQIKAGAWWGQGEPLIISAAGQGSYIRDIVVDGVQAAAENSVIVHGTDGNISGIQLSDWSLSLSEGRNRPLYGQSLDLAPFAAQPVPEGLPWLYVNQAADVLLRHVRYTGDDAVIDESAEVEQADVKRRPRG